VDNTSGNCDQIGKAWTFTNLGADRYGYWNGQPNYQPNEALYTFQLFDFVSTTEDYASWIINIQNILATMGSKMKKQDLAINLMYG